MQLTLTYTIGIFRYHFLHISTRVLQNLKKMLTILFYFYVLKFLFLVYVLIMGTEYIRFQYSMGKELNADDADSGIYQNIKADFIDSEDNGVLNCPITEDEKE